MTRDQEYNDRLDDLESNDKRRSRTEESFHVGEDDLKRIVKEAVKETLTLLGVKVDDPVEMQQDFTHLRKWRKAVDTAQSTSMLTALGILVTGAMGALWLGIQTMLDKR